MRIAHICPDDKQSSGVNYFCTSLDASLGECGVESRVLRSFLPLAKDGLVLHLHGLWQSAQHTAAVWARQNDVPVVWSTHGMSAPWSMRHKWWKKYPAWWLYQKRDLLSAAVIHVTSEQERTWNRRVGLVNRQVVLPLGTEFADAIASPFKCAAKRLKFTVLFVGRIYPVKGLMNLVRAAAILKDDSFRFRIVGPDQAGHMLELERECDRLGVGWTAPDVRRDADAALVEFVGEKRGAELRAEYEACDLLVLPSFTENFGGVVVDALAHGKPVIASRFAPWRELDERRCGWWVSNTPESLAAVIAAARRLPPDELRQMGLRGVRLVKEKYTWEAVAKRMADCYRSLLQGGG